MAHASKEYLRSLIPKGLPAGKELLEEGRKIAPFIEAGRSGLVRESNCGNYLELFKKQAAQENIFWVSQIGLPTAEETAAGIKELRDWAEKLSLNYNYTLAIPSTLQAVPKEARKYDMKSTSYVHETLEDFMSLGNIKGMEVMQGDQVLGVPNSWETGISALKAGSYQVGCISQLMWNYPDCGEHEKYVTEMLKVMGVLSAKWEEGFGVSGYMDDGFPSYCKDAVAYVAWALFEQYVATQLCGVRYTVGYGGLLSDIRVKSALLKALYDSLYREDQPPVLFLHANTTRYWDHDIEANYGMLAQEILMSVLAERRYRTGAMILPVPITEKVHVPTVEAIKNVLGMASRLEENIEQWEDVVDFARIDEIAETLKERGAKMFHNLLDGLDSVGFDIEDPLHMLMFIKKFDASLFEETFHPDISEKGKADIQFYTDMGLLTKKMVDETKKEVKEANLEHVLKGKRILLASTDTHIYGVHYMKAVLEYAGAEVVEAGADSSVEYIFDTADEEGIRYIGISTHNGQALGIAGQVLAETQKRSGGYIPFLGGVLNTILPGHSEPSDVKDMINQKGVFADNDLMETIKLIRDH
ncbi:cobalamin B12-binding domain-containing protein [Anaerovorax odorimutans]|uniref:Cobalamin B12-binding domain-containing protein n=1 Tax=Anaerovorax odorimutans TaxID=109327 RepID=A0ABT1RRN6_9FIRM|nr:cobalamin B12-binding domain-containing protein [Anaerovorax odorimutans]MCQ4637864.1 cobalamin B12-binding domain-containing protein [Anaerovorax odorimutans]